MGTDIRLFGYATSSCTQKVLLTLHEKHARADLVPIDIAAGEQHGEGNPHPFHRVPTLVDGTFVLYESRAIIRYLDATLPGAPLSPLDPRVRATMEQWISVEYSYLSGPVLDLVRAVVWRPAAGESPDMQTAEKSLGEIASVLDVANAHLAKSPYLAGEGFSLAEICWMPYISKLFETGVGVLVADRPALAAWWNGVSQRESWRSLVGTGDRPAEPVAGHAVQVEMST